MSNTSADEKPSLQDASSVPERASTPTGKYPPTNPSSETPARARGIDSHSYRNGSLDERRKAVLEDIGAEIPEVDMEFFFENLLPSLPPLDLNAIVESLKSENTIMADKWKWFTTEPKSSTKKETETFSPLADIFDAVTRLALAQVPDLPQTLVLRLEPDETPGSERKSTMRPDVYFILKEASDPNATHLWYDLVGTAEIKKRDSEKDRDDNVIKQIYSMQHAMSVDPCRRFTFGITVENTNMRLWFASRTVVTVSVPFNFNTAHNTLVHIFLALAFGSKTDLGWDPTISVNTIDGKRVYVFDVDGKKYETVDILSDNAADSLIGRATRAYTVRDMDTNTEHVLKDVWAEDGYSLEHLTHGKLVNAVGDQLGDEAKEETKNYLLTTRDYCIVSIDGQKDHSTNLIMRGQEPSFRSTFRLVLKDPAILGVQKSTAAPVASDMDAPDGQQTRVATRVHSLHTRLRIHHRTHYRIVFEEVAEPIWMVRKLSDVFVVLRDVCRVLRYIHKCGYVHRDISPGNIYFYKGRGLLGDLEYTKLLSEKGSHDLRTGTLDTMAIEVADGQYWFTPSDDDEGFLEIALDYSRMKSDVDIVLTAFAYNVLHDMESTWWVGIWILFFNRDASISHEQALKAQEDTTTLGLKADWDYERKTREYWTEILFPRTLLVQTRYNFFTGRTYSAATNRLSRTFGGVIKNMNHTRRILHSSYKEFEKTFAVNDFDLVHKVFIDVTDFCIGDSGTIELDCYKEIYK